MLNISKINNLNFKTLQPTDKQNKTSKYQSIPGFSPKYKYNLNADTVSFKGAPAFNITEARAIIEASKKRANWLDDFGPKVIEKISETVTEKSFPFLERILLLDNKKLGFAGVIALLEYINNEETKEEEVDEKINNYNNMGNIVKGFGFKQSVLPGFFDKISKNGVVDIIKSDILLNDTKHNFNSFPQVYNYAVKHYQHEMKKQPKDLEQKTKDRLTTDFMRDKFANILVLGSIFDESVCNEILYNRGLYVNDLYIPRLKSLNDADLKLLRRTQTSAVTDKENKGGDLVVYEISLDDKISMLNLLAANREIINAGYEGLNFKEYIKPVNVFNKDGNFKINFQQLKIDLMDKVLRRIGVEDKVVDKYMANFKEVYERSPELKNNKDKYWDINYVHLLNAPEGSLLRDIVVNATNGNFRKWIFKESPLAEINRKNEEAFTNAGIDYDRWLDPQISATELMFKNKAGTRIKEFTVKNWRRIPQESLLDGNYTTCCTGLDKNHGQSFLKYITNTCTTTLEVRTEKDKVVAMSRIMMAKINGKLSMIVENIEVNNKMAKHYLHNDKARYRFREMIFDYARRFADDINMTDEQIPIYFCGQNFKVKDIEKGLGPIEICSDWELIGEYPDKLYVNVYGKTLDKSQIHDDGDEVKFKLIDITEKAKPVIDDEDEIESDSNYNYQDVLDFNQKP